jgi:hypothetical protein
MPTDLATEYRTRSNHCGRQAENSDNPLDKARWLQFAEQWAKLAEDPRIAESPRSDCSGFDTSVAGEA